MTYVMPWASDLLLYTVGYSCQTKPTLISLRVKGCGEARATGSPPTVVNAVINELHSGDHTNATLIDMPVLLSRV